MCQMSVVLEKDGNKETLLENVTLLEVEGNKVMISTLFDDPEEVSNVRVKKMDFSDGVIVLTQA